MALLTDRSYDYGLERHMKPILLPQRFGSDYALAAALVVPRGAPASISTVTTGHHSKIRSASRPNRTMAYLRANHPDLAGMVDAGLPVAEAWRRVLTGWRPAEPDAMPIDDGPDSPDPGHWQRGTDPSREGQLLRAGPQEDHPGSLDTGMTNQSPAGNQPEFGESDGVMLYRPSTLEAFEALPSGVLYLDPGDNRVYRKI